MSVSPKALILLTSRPESLEIAVKQLRPEVLAVIVSQEVLEAVVLKGAELKRAGLRLLYRMVDDPMEISNAFSAFELALSDLEELGYGRGEVWLDATGGTTPMRLGAALGAMTRGLSMVHQRVPQRYVDGRWERDLSRGVEVVAMENPLEATGLLREGQGVELFNSRDYGAAALVFGDVAEKVSGAERGHYYRGLTLLSEGYAAWDVADYGAALEKLRVARDELGTGFSETALSERAEELVAWISLHLPFLGRLRGRLSWENVTDMLENARRRIVDQGRYDDGVARLYRCVEMHHQRRLAERGVDAGAVRWEKLEEGVRERFLGEAGLKELPEVLGLRHARVLDRILSGEGAQDEAVLRDLLQKRNRSILAHGMEPIGREAAMRFLEHVDGLARDDARDGARHLVLRGL